MIKPFEGLALAKSGNLFYVLGMKDRIRFKHSCILLLCGLWALGGGGCETRQNLRSHPNFGKFVGATVKTTRDQKLYYGSEVDSVQSNRQYRFFTGVEFGGVDHYVIPKGTEMFIERVYRFGAIDADYVVALGYLHRNGEKLEFECKLHSVDERPPWKLK